MKNIRIIVADDHPIILESLSNLLSKEETIEVVCKASNGVEVLQCLSKEVIDLVIMDINMPEMNGLECLKEISAHHNRVKTLILTIYEEEYIINKLLQRGADGFLLKNAKPEKILEAVNRIMEGHNYFDDVKEVINMQKTFKEDNDLTPREIEIIKCIMEGSSSVEIGEKLYISEQTVQTHRKNILRKLELTNTAQLVAFAKSSGIL